MTRNRAIQSAALIILGALALAILADMISWFLAEDYSPIRQTISTLAVGRSSWLIDLGLRAFALACAVAAITMALMPQTGRLWLPGCLATGFLGLDVAWISFLNEYAGTENEAADLHSWGVYALYVLFAAAALSTSSALAPAEHRAAMRMRLMALLWILLGPVYYFWYPPAILGALERVLALLMIAHVALVAQVLRHRTTAA